MGLGEKYQMFEAAVILMYSGKEVNSTKAYVGKCTCKTVVSCLIGASDNNSSSCITVDVYAFLDVPIGQRS